MRELPEKHEEKGRGRGREVEMRVLGLAGKAVTKCSEKRILMTTF